MTFGIKNYILPNSLTELVNYFNLTKHEIKNDELHFYFTELNSAPDKFKDNKLTSKGFFPQATVQDFLIREKNVFYT